MAEGRQRADWDRASAIVAQLYNQAVRPRDRKPDSFFNPYRKNERAKRRTATRDDLAMIRARFFPKKK